MPKRGSKTLGMGRASTMHLLPSSLALRFSFFTSSGLTPDFVPLDSVNEIPVKELVKEEINISPDAVPIGQDYIYHAETTKGCKDWLCFQFYTIFSRRTTQRRDHILL